MKKEKTYKLNQSEYRKKLRDEERLLQLKDIVEKAHQITRQIKRDKKGVKLFTKE